MCNLKAADLVEVGQNQVTEFQQKQTTIVTEV